MNDAARDETHEAPFTIGEWAVDPARRSLSRADKVVKLSPRGVAALLHLADRAGEVVTRDELLEHFGRGAESSPNALHKVIVELRHAFATDGDETTYFETVPRRGYRLAASVAGRGPRGDATVSPPRATTAPWRHRRVALITAVAIAALLVWFAESFWPVPAQAPIEARAVSVATTVVSILPVRHAGGSAAAATIAEEVTDALRRAVSAWPGVAVSTERAGTSAFVIEGDVRESLGRVRLDVVMSRASDGEQLYAERYDVDTLRSGDLGRDATADLLSALEVLLDDDRLIAMRASGTHRVKAYRMKEEGDSLRRSMGQRAIELGAERLRDAINLDPQFKGGYASLGAALGDLGTLALDAAHRRELSREVMRLDEAMLPTLRQRPDLPSIWIANQQLNATSWEDFERRLRVQIATIGTRKDSPATPMLPSYAALLASARLDTHAERVLGLAAREENHDISFDYRRHDVATWNSEPLRAIARERQLLGEHPQAVLTLLDLVAHLAYLHDFGEADRYLARLIEADTDGRWAYLARLLVSAFRGDFEEASALTAALGDARATDYGRGVVHFIRNDIDAGAAAWARVDTDALRNLVLRTVVFERLFPESVCIDARYQASLEQLGVGANWTAYMLEKSTELEPVFTDLAK